MSVRKPTCPQQMGDAAAVNVDKLGKIGERPRQPVDLINNDHVDLACLDIGTIGSLLFSQAEQPTSGEAKVVGGGNSQIDDVFFAEAEQADGADSRTMLLRTGEDPDRW